MTWTKEEEAILIINTIDSVKNGGSINSSFNTTAIEINKTKNACECKWHTIKQNYLHLINFTRNRNKKTNEIKIIIEWSKEEDEILTAAIQDAKKNHIKIGDALRAVSIKLNRSFAACKIRWYEDLKEAHYGRKRGLRREWTLLEDSEFVNMVRTYSKNNKSLTDALEAVSEKLKRSYTACSIRWNEKLKHNHLDIKFTVGIIIKRWENSEDIKLISIFEEQFKQGKNIREACLVASHCLDRSAKSCETRWTDIKHLYPTVIAKYAPKRSWKDEDDAFFISTMKKYLNQKKTALSAINYIANKLNRSLGACQVRWSTVLSKK